MRLPSWVFSEFLECNLSYFILITLVFLLSSAMEHNMFNSLNCRRIVIIHDDNTCFQSQVSYL